MRVNLGSVVESGVVQGSPVRAECGPGEQDDLLFSLLDPAQGLERSVAGASAHGVVDAGGRLRPSSSKQQQK